MTNIINRVFLKRVWIKHENSKFEFTRNNTRFESAFSVSICNYLKNDKIWTF